MYQRDKEQYVLKKVRLDNVGTKERAAAFQEVHLLSGTMPTHVDGEHSTCTFARVFYKRTLSCPLRFHILTAKES